MSGGTGALPRRHSAGGVLWRPGTPDAPDQPRIAVVHRPRHDDWSLPKGALDPGEHALMAACREVAEETGWQPVAGRRLPSQTYLLTDSSGSDPNRPTGAVGIAGIAAASGGGADTEESGSGHSGVSHPDSDPNPGTTPPPPAGTDRPGEVVGAASRRTCVPAGTRAAKTVEFWAMRAEAHLTRTPDAEVDAVAWLPPRDALSRLSYAGDREVLQAFLAAPAELTTLVLVRHASAGRRQDWAGDDRSRPLDALGRTQVARLTEALRCFGPRRILAADRARCVETVTPLATALGLGVRVDPVFSEDVYDADPARVLALLRELSATASGCTVVCGQGGAIPDLVGTLSRLDSVSPTLAAGSPGPMPGVRPPEPTTSPVDLPADKASAWVLSFHGRPVGRGIGRLVAADYYPDFAAPKPR